MDKATNSRVDEHRLIDAAYSAILNPLELDVLEKSWESFIVAGEDSGSFEDSDEEFNRSFNRASIILHRLIRLTRQSRDVQTLVEINPGIALIANQQGNIIAMNVTAHKVMGNADTVAALLIEEKAKNVITQWLASIGKFGNEIYCFASIYLQNRNSPTYLVATPINIVSEDDKETSFALITSLDLILAEYLIPHIQTAYCLTPAEAEVCLLLSNGMTATEVADERKASINTIRTQIKTSIEKIGARNQTDLVRQLCGLAARLSHFSVQEQLGKSLPKSSQSPYFFELPDGRRLHVHEQGDPSGNPCLYLHGIWNGPRLFGPIEAMLKDAGRRFIAPSRAGFGLSDAAPFSDRTQRLNSFSDNLLSLLDHLKIDKLPLSGEYYAQHFAARHPDRVSAVIYYHMVPYWDESLLNEMTRRRRNLILTSRHLPHSVRLLAQFGQNLIEGGKAAYFLKGLARGSIRNQELLNDPQFLDFAIAECRHNVAQGIDAFVQDVPLLHADLTETTKKMRCPVHIIHYRNNTHGNVKAVEDFAALHQDTTIHWIDAPGLAGYMEGGKHLITALNMIDDA